MTKDYKQQIIFDLQASQGQPSVSEGHKQLAKRVDKMSNDMPEKDRRTENLGQSESPPLKANSENVASNSTLEYKSCPPIDGGESDIRAPRANIAFSSPTVDFNKGVVSNTPLPNSHDFGIINSDKQLSRKDLPFTSNSQILRSKTAQYMGGEDWFEFVAVIRFSQTQWEFLARSFHELQLSYKDNNCPNPGVMSLQNCEIRVEQFGQKVGGNFYMPYILKCNGIEISFLPPQLADSIGWNAQVIVRSLPLIQAGNVEYVIVLINNIIAELGGTIESTTISRVDICVDLPNIDVSVFCKMFKNGCMISKGNKGQLFSTQEHFKGNCDTGISVIEKGNSTGIRTNGRITLRIYDKIAELKVKHDVLKIEAMKLRYGGELPQKATRIEFQLRGKALRAFNVNTIEEWIVLRKGITMYLVEDYIKFCTKRTAHYVKGNHHSRIKVSPKWKNVQKAFKYVFGEAMEKVKPQKPIRNPDQTQLEKQINGCISTYAAIEGKTIANKENYYSIINQLFEKADLRKMEIKSIQKRQRKYMDSGNAISNFIRNSQNLPDDS